MSVVGPSRIARFVAAARSLLVVQLLLALLATGIAAWAFFEVRAMAAERDRLQARVAELEAAQRIAPVTIEGPINPPLYAPPVDTQPPPLDTPPPSLLPPAGIPPSILPPTTTPPTTTTPPPTPLPAPAPDVVEPTPPLRTAPVERDCSGPSSGRPGCPAPLDRPVSEPLPDNLTPRGAPLGPNQLPPRGG